MFSVTWWSWCWDFNAIEITASRCQPVVTISQNLVHFCLYCWYLCGCRGNSKDTAGQGYHQQMVPCYRSCCFVYTSQIFLELGNVLGCTRKYRCSWVTGQTVTCNHLNQGDSWLLTVQIEVTGSSCQAPAIEGKSIMKKIFSTTLSALLDTVEKLSEFHSLE